MHPLLPNHISFTEKLLRKIFKSYFKTKDEHKAFIQKFPCPKCRPNLSCTYYFDIEFKCEKCGRIYYE